MWKYFNGKECNSECKNVQYLNARVIFNPYTKTNGIKILLEA